MSNVTYIHNEPAFAKGKAVKHHTVTIIIIPRSRA